MIVTFRAPEPPDAGKVAVLMCDIDVAECRAAGHTPWQALHAAQRSSALCWTGEVNGWPQAMFGVVPGSLSSGLGYPWFLGSNTARKAVRHFLRTAPEYLAQMEVLFPRLEGMVSTRNSSAIRWLVRMGFVVEDAVTAMHGEPMVRFSKGF